jgi:hypothetical protein
MNRPRLGLTSSSSDPAQALITCANGAFACRHEALFRKLFAERGLPSTLANGAIGVESIPRPTA